MPLHPVATALLRIEEQLNGYYLERREAIRAALLAVLAKQHYYALGTPGVAKSDMIRALVGCFTGSSYFEVALSKTRPIEAVMGPLDLKRFRETGDYVLKRKGFASKSDFIFLDEVGKMSAVTGHDLLALLNERIYHEVNGGLSTHDAPLMTAFTASNELLTNESDDAAALWDRLLVRVIVDDIKEADNFRALVLSGEADITATVDFEELKKAIEVDVPAIDFSPSGLEGLVKLRKAMEIEHLYPSARRWKQSVKVLRANAFLNGRSQIEEEDLAVLKFTLWDTVETIGKVHDMCAIAANPYVSELMAITTGIREVRTEITTRESDARQKAAQQGTPFSAADLMPFGRDSYKKLLGAHEKLKALARSAQDRVIPGYDETFDLLREVLILNGMTCLDQEREEAETLVDRKLATR